MATVDDVDDLCVVDAVEIDRGHTEVRVTELALDDVHRDAFPGHLDRVRVSELMRREAAANTGVLGDATQ